MKAKKKDWGVGGMKAKKKDWGVGGMKAKKKDWGVGGMKANEGLGSCLIVPCIEVMMCWQIFFDHVIKNVVRHSCKKGAFFLHGTS
jgi:hypothetical protein